MGIKHRHELTHSISGLSINRLDLIGQYLYKLPKSNPNIQRFQQPTLDSWLYRSKNKITENNRLRKVIDICLAFARVGFAVVLVCDGAQRHHSKRASTERSSKLYNNTIKGYIARSNLMQLVKERLQSDNIAEKN